ncbi:hemolysin XhlA family protein [Shinella sp. WSJ-2]|uniref:hemolysin XhlA family protein n=1 Tax=Shinella sp. WSJ-2 TaxID=2303749 RepID=UPI001FE1ED6D|nr:hemolysin XhlA family protein [Shinella sp. WSJ-2]
MSPSDEPDLRSRMVSAEHSLQGLLQRLTLLETWKQQRDIESARHDEKWNAMETRIDNRFSGLEKSVHDIQTSLTWINRLIVGGIVTGIVAFLVRGGFAP